MTTVYITINESVIIPGQPVHWRWSIGPILPKQGGYMATDVTITTEQDAILRCIPESSPGVPAPVEGPVTYTIISGTCTLEALVPPDALSVRCVSHEVGDSVVQASADADLGAGVVLLTDAIHIHVIAALAENLNLLAEVVEKVP